MKQVLLIPILIIALTASATAQQACEVKLKSIQGTYTGACENGLANGQGKSVGTDQYEGTFKNGYPDSAGMYTWKDGHYFVGNFKKGNKEGAGKMYYESASGNDSIITGFWKKDKYIGEYENPYTVHYQSSGVSNVKCNLITNKSQDIDIEVHQLNSFTTTANSGMLPFITDIIIKTGSFYTKNLQVLSNSSVTHIQGVVFPFRAQFILNNGEIAEVIFNEAGGYSVNIDIL